MMNIKNYPYFDGQHHNDLEHDKHLKHPEHNDDQKNLSHPWGKSN